jgi:hypothetical protein
MSIASVRPLAFGCLDRTSAMSFLNLTNARAALSRLVSLPAIERCRCFARYVRPTCKSRQPFAPDSLRV